MPTIKKHSRPKNNKSRLKHSWYKTLRWIKLSREFRTKNPFCVQCKEENVLTDCSPGKRTGVTDHKKPVSSGKDTGEQYRLMWDWWNLQTLCNHHHAIKSAKEGHGSC